MDAAGFDALRPRLTRIAYRMLGSWAEAEDVVQDAWLRWQTADQTEVRDPPAFLARTVSRLSLDVLKSARVKREAYVGEWLPEPIVDDTDNEEDDGVTGSLMLAMERLSPLERVAFLLHDVFGMDFEEVGRSIGREAAACRQLAARARTHIRAARPRFPVSPEKGREIAEAFFHASRDGDASALASLLAADVQIVSDGGGQVMAFLKTISGLEKVVRMFLAAARKGMVTAESRVRFTRIDGLPGFISEEPGGMLQTTALEIEDGRITRILIVRNPDKLGQVKRLLQ